MYKVKVNDDKEREIILDKNNFTINGADGSWDKISIAKNRFHILKDNRSYLCDIISTDFEKKTFEIKVNGHLYKIELKDRFYELLQRMGMGDAGKSKVNNIKAPMPGLVLSIMVKEGQEIKQGDSVLILEAMKMENVIKSQGNGTVKAIKVKTKDAVEKGQVLVELG